MALTRRALVHGLGATGLFAGLAPTFARAEALGERRLILLILRGGLDGLAAVPPWADPEHARARGGVAVPVPGAEGGALDLDGSFGLHPALAPIHPWFAEGRLGILHAAALPYRERSHFDAQNVLETGASKPFASDTGWLNRAVGAVDGQLGVPMAMARTVPLVLRGDAPVTSADPLRSWMPGDSLVDRIADLYAVDPHLGPALETALATQGMLEAHRSGAMGSGAPARPDELRRSARVIGTVLAASDGPRIAVVENGGWDTHAGQDRALERQLGGLAGALAGIRDGLGKAWEHTAILVVSEFGRTVAANGTQGTDHGTAGVALVAGGAVRGGAVHGRWPGLGSKHLVDGRDLQPTTEVRALFKGALIAHLGIPRSTVEDRVFRGTQALEPLVDLFRA